MEVGVGVGQSSLAQHQVPHLWFLCTQIICTWYLIWFAGTYHFSWSALSSSNRELRLALVRSGEEVNFFSISIQISIRIRTRKMNWIRLPPPGRTEMVTRLLLDRPFSTSGLETLWVSSQWWLITTALVGQVWLELEEGEVYEPSHSRRGYASFNGYRIAWRLNCYIDWSYVLGNGLRKLQRFQTGEATW